MGLWGSGKPDKAAPWFWTLNVIRLIIIILLKIKFPALPIILDHRNWKTIFKAKISSKSDFRFFDCLVLIFFPPGERGGCGFFSSKIKVLWCFPPLLCKAVFSFETSQGVQLSCCNGEQWNTFIKVLGEQCSGLGALLVLKLNVTAGPPLLLSN